MGTTFGPSALSAQTDLIHSNEDRILHGLDSKSAYADDAKIAKGAKEFEAMLLATWMQQAEQSMATVPGVEEDDDMAGGSQLTGLGVQSVATSLADAGGIGIGRMIAKALHAMAEKNTHKIQQNQEDTGTSAIGK
jgi:Rod binding domain-containing protein